MNDTVYFDMCTSSTRGVRLGGGGGPCLIGQPDIDWLKGRDLESERKLTAPVMVLRHHQINFVV